MTNDILASSSSEEEAQAGMPADGRPLLELRGITKRFPNVVANDNISLAIRSGEIHTLLGENGAGKSTLLNILSGMLQPDAGTILVAGQAVTLPSPRAALKLGIGTVYQHFTLVPTLSVLENVVLGDNYGFMLDFDRAERRLRAMLQNFGLAVSPRLEVRHLSIGQQQRLEIIKALMRGSRVLLLDEPTSVLTPPEAGELFALLGQLKIQGAAIIFITHKLDEALAISDRVTVLRQGRVVGQIKPAALATAGKKPLFDHIVGLMFGGSPPGQAETPLVSPPRPGQRICALRNITIRNDQGRCSIREFTLELHAGEIVGIAGVDGNGQKELGEVIAGQRPVVNGELVWEGIEAAGPGTARVGYISDDRLGEACVPGLSVAENAVLKVFHRPPFSRWSWLNRPAIEAHARRLIEEFRLKASGPWARVATLSGGNIQKLLVGRELTLKPRLLVCNQPTQGLDFLTAQTILRTLRQEADAGMAVLLFSAELDDLMAVSDRIGVLANGRLQALLSRSQADRETIGRLMLGSKT